MSGRFLIEELRIRQKGGHEGIKELEIMCGKAADELQRLWKYIAVLESSNRWNNYGK